MLVLAINFTFSFLMLSLHTIIFLFKKAHFILQLVDELVLVRTTVDFQLKLSILLLKIVEEW